MNIVSGIATASGVSSLLNAPRDSNATLRVVSGDPAPQAALRSAEGGAGAARRTETVRPVSEPARAEGAPASLRRESSDPRYTQFLDAVTALRVDLSEETLTRQRISELRSAAKEIFNLDGVPADTAPDPTETGAEAARAEAAQRAERADQLRQARAQEAEADRLEAEARRAEADRARAEAAAPAAGTAPVADTGAPLPDLPEPAPAVQRGGSAPAFADTDTGAVPEGVPEAPAVPDAVATGTPAAEPGAPASAPAPGADTARQD